MYDLSNGSVSSELEWHLTLISRSRCNIYAYRCPQRIVCAGDARSVGDSEVLVCKSYARKLKWMCFFSEHSVYQNVFFQQLHLYYGRRSVLGPVNGIVQRQRRDILEILHLWRPGHCLCCATKPVTFPRLTRISSRCELLMAPARYPRQLDEDGDETRRMA